RRSPDLRRGAKTAVDLAAEAKRAQLQAAHVGEAFDFAPEPAAHAYAGIAAHEGLHAERRVKLVPQCLSAAGIDPGDMLVRRQAKRHGGEESRGRPLALPVERGGCDETGDTHADQ